MESITKRIFGSDYKIMKNIVDDDILNHVAECIYKTVTGVIDGGKLMYSEPTVYIPISRRLFETVGYDNQLFIYRPHHNILNIKKEEMYHSDVEYYLDLDIYHYKIPNAIKYSIDHIYDFPIDELKSI